MAKTLHIHIHTTDSLQPGSRKAAFQHNVKTEIEAGNPQKQAVAIAYSKQRETNDNWEESKHPRASNGQFGSGGGGAKASSAKSATAKQVQSAPPASGGGAQKEAPARPKQRSNAKTESYSWGKLTTVSNPSITAVAHPEDRQAIHALGDGEVYKYTDEQKHKWEVSRHGDEIYFTEPHSKTAALTAKRSDFESKEPGQVRSDSAGKTPTKSDHVKGSSGQASFGQTQKIAQPAAKSSPSKQSFGTLTEWAKKKGYPAEQVKRKYDESLAYHKKMFPKMQGESLEHEVARFAKSNLQTYGAEEERKGASK